MPSFMLQNSTIKLSSLYSTISKLHFSLHDLKNDKTDYDMQLRIMKLHPHKRVKVTSIKIFFFVLWVINDKREREKHTLFAGNTITIINQSSWNHTILENNVMFSIWKCHG